MTGKGIISDGRTCRDDNKNKWWWRMIKVVEGYRNLNTIH